MNPANVDRRSVWLGCAWLALGSVPCAEVLIVDASNGPSSDFASLQVAIDVAQPGDVLIVRSGTYPDFTLAGKELTIVGEGSPAPSFASTFDATGFHQTTVRDVPAGGRVVLHGLAFTGQLVAGLTLTDNGGAIWIEECSIEGLDVVNTSASVARCTLSATGNTLLLGGSDLALYDSVLQGTFSRSGSTLLCSNTTIPGSCDLSGSDRSFAVAAPVGVGQPILETYRGAAGELAVLGVSLASVPWVHAPQLSDAVHVSGAAPFFFLARGLLPASGTKTVTTPFDGLETLDALVLYEQAFFVDPVGPTVRISGPSALVLLNPNFDPQPGGH